MKPVSNIQAVLDSASESQWLRGKYWYLNAHDICQGLAYAYDIPLVQVCGVVAALSPATSPRRNFEDTDMLLSRLYGTYSNRGLNTYGKQVYKAYLCLGAESATDVECILNGPKTRAFFKLLFEPRHPSAVVVDRHSAGVVDNRRISKASFTDKQHEEYATAYRAIAKLNGLRPSQVQAITWLKWKEDLEQGPYKLQRPTV